jgi:hypothetical protein
VAELHYHERMRGWVSFDARDYNTGVVDGRKAGTRCDMTLSVEVDDFDSFIRDPEYPARLSGRVRCPQLGGDLDGEDGTLNLFADAPDGKHRRALYRLFVRDPAGRPLTMTGFKLVGRGTTRHPWLNGSVWCDTSSLLVRLLKGHVTEGEEEEDDPRTIATGVLGMGPLGFLGTVLSVRGRRLRDVVRFGREFVHRLRATYAGPRFAAAQFDYPTRLRPRPGDRVTDETDWHPPPERPDLVRRILRFETDDGCELNVHHLSLPGEHPGRGTPDRDPVLLIGGLAMRAQSFYTSPTRPTLVDVLLKKGYDVWVENWRTSLDLPARSYTLDRAARYDHPAAIRKVLKETKREHLAAVAHCMGSASLTMSVLAGKAPELRRVVSSAVSYDIELAARSKRRLKWQLPIVRLFSAGTDPQWAARAPSLTAAGLSRIGRLRRAYSNPLVAAATYIYGGEPEAMWMRANLDEETLEWVAREFGYAPFTFFKQMHRSSQAKHLVPDEALPDWPPDLAGRLPPEGTSFTFIAGAQNRFFLPEAQERTWAYFESKQPRVHHHKEFPGYSHYDVLIGRRAAKDVFGYVLGALEGKHAD